MASSPTAIDLSRVPAPAAIAALDYETLLADGIDRFVAQWEMERVANPLLPVYVVYPPNSHLSAKVRAFVDWVVDLFARNPLLQDQRSV